MDFLELAKDRYSVRKFEDRPVEKEKLDYILEAGNVAPTAKNLQPQRIYVLQSVEALQKINELSPCVFGAKTVLVFAYNTDEEWQNPLEAGVHSGVEDVSIVATHVMLAAASIGLGTCWCNYFPNTKLEEALGLPSNEKTVLFMPVGYIAEGSVPSVNHSAVKEIGETVKYI
ncbi:MAG: nitroreductase family protein [Lachnospiraceae bacterium]|nr:nitroreductase family protein [Lachnospiraceae bacterium]